MDKKPNNVRILEKVVPSVLKRNPPPPLPLLNASLYANPGTVKNPVIYHRGERRVRRVLRLFQSLFRLSGAFAFSVCSAVKFKDLAISLENSTVPCFLREK